MARRGSIVRKGREAAVVRGAQLPRGQVPGCQQHPLTHFGRRFHHRVDRVDDTDEYRLTGLQMPADDLQHSRRILFARQLNVKAPNVQLKKSRQQAAVIHAGAMRSIPVAAWTGMHANTLALLRRKAIEHLAIQRDEVMQQAAGRVEFEGEASLREIDLYAIGSLREATPDIGGGFGYQVREERLARVPRNFRTRVKQA